MVSKVLPGDLIRSNMPMGLTPSIIVQGDRFKSWGRLNDLIIQRDTPGVVISIIKGSTDLDVAAYVVTPEHIGWDVPARFTLEVRP